MMKRDATEHPRRAHPWSAPLAIDDVPETGRHIAITADEATRAAVAELAEVRAIPRLQASFDVTRHGRDGLHVVGQVSATVGQDCVVTLDPIENEVIEEIDLIFTPAAPPVASDETVAEVTEVPEEDAPEPLIGGVVDLGGIATEFLILGIDPYPRKPGVVFEPPEADTAAKPFAALAALKKGEGGHER
jgi:hypothetical protein